MPNSIREIAYEDYRAGLSPAEIERKHDGEIKADTVRKWIKRHWAKDGRTAGQDKKRDNRTKGQRDRTGQAPTPQEIDRIIFEAVEENTELTEKQKDFCRYFVRNKNATQAYFKAYGCSYSAAGVEGFKNLTKPKIQAEIKRLKAIKHAALGDLCGDDIVMKHMEIAFSDLTDYVEIENVIATKQDRLTGKAKPIVIVDPETKEAKPLIKTSLKLKASSEIDGTLLTEISEGREGIKVKLADKQKSLDFLARYFELNPMDKHRRDYDNRKLALEEQNRGSEGIESVRIVLERRNERNDTDA